MGNGAPFARRFNATYGVECFEPASFYYSNKAIKVPGLDGSGKIMSEGNAIYLIDDEKQSRRR